MNEECVTVGGTLYDVRKVKLTEVINSLLQSIGSDDVIKKAVIEISYKED